MDFKDSPGQAEFRAEARAWLEEQFPAWKAAEDVTGEPPYPTEVARSWHRVLHAGGWAAPSWPPQFGGRGLGFVEGTIWAEEKARVGANVPFDIPGFGMAGPTIVAHGSEEQQARFLPPLLAGEELWCQLFSEPGAGSDLANLTTRAELDGDEWVVTGQKVWSSAAHEADWGILIARHDFDLPKHKGLVYLIVDMHAAGIEVRPLRQMDGGSHFNEVFLNGVRVPDANRLGEPGDGWKVAVTTLMNERVSLGAATAGFAIPFDRLTATARAAPAGLRRVDRDALARVYTSGRILELLNARVVSKLGKGQIPDAEGSVMKLVLAKLVSDSAELAVHLLGPEGTVEDEAGLQHTFLGSLAFHLGGGTDQIQRNLIGERVLGLPRDEQPDRTLPFREALAARST
jgi:alkylation response protein AidB-like acyl-CoA dehydrogenase